MGEGSVILFSRHYLSFLFMLHLLPSFQQLPFKKRGCHCSTLFKMGDLGLTAKQLDDMCLFFHAKTKFTRVVTLSSVNIPGDAAQS